MTVLNGAATVAEAVAAALNQDYGGEVEVVVAHGPSRDGTAAILARLATDPRVRLVPNPSGGTAAGLNAAIAASRGEVIARCDAQSRFPHYYLRRAVEILAQTGADNVGGTQAAEGAGFLQRAVAIAQTTYLGVGDARYRTGGKPGPVDTVYLGVFRRTALERVGGFDEGQVRNQDYELNWRLRQSGGTVYFHPDLAVAYAPRAGLRPLWRQYWEYGTWKRVMLRKHPRSLRWRQLAAPGLVAGLVWSPAMLLTPWPWAAAPVPGAYLAALLTTAALEAARRRDSATLALLLVLPTMHFAWGLGFLVGRARPLRGAPA
ncbi:MAG: glycosyltransferase family 2 protein [Acidimicrobiia bacterium]|nr:glycosyltransferase family 2 protein [Acidimicrobiia bacterium]